MSCSSAALVVSEAPAGSREGERKLPAPPRPVNVLCYHPSQ